MGGGDLNLKKSWHPSTMKNMEKVRKAEQQNDQENKRIAELKKEIEIEKDLEDIKKYAIEQGVLEKKDDKKLDWMYKGPNQMINREEYLLGRPVDKAFEQMQQAVKDTELNRMPKNHVEYECIPPSLRFFSGTEQVDLARKIQEDPLYAIKKKEMESRNQLLKNPVKLKQLKELLEQQSCKDKSEKKKSKQKDSSEDETKLDILLATKYKQLKDNITEKNLLKSMKKIKHKRMKKSKKHYYNSDSETDNSNNDKSIKKKRHKQRKKRKRSTDDSDSDSIDSNKKIIIKHNTKDKKEVYDRKYSRNDTRVDDREKVKKRNLSEDRKIEDKNLRYGRNKKQREEYNKNDDRQCDSKQRDGSRNKYNDKKCLVEKQNDTKNRKEEKYTPHTKSRPGLTEKEKEQRRKEMMENAVWRNKEREKNVKMYREQEKKEEQNNISNNKDFIRKQLIVVTEVGTVASRIKANINNIQRSGRAMDTNFVKR
ncbi:pre-mRNA-splicing factor CWC25 homolog [Monomorium pharaonis]|uniref:pre-mRNA-splicing factor CWC25 homolog n=1 Tax=Monomorium pharaonis TaxID=307658 RepID=UPI00063F2BC3|nr:pre-mRNA-splicing factor CWC25 homolog [Monomorium pharaonis]